METEWNLKVLEEDFESKKKTIEKDVENFAQKWKNRKDYLETPVSMKEILDDYEKLLENCFYGNKENYYYSLKAILDESNTEIKAKLNKSEDFTKEMSNKVSFVEINISKIPKEKQKNFIQSPLLKDYKHYIESLFKNGKYILSKEEEKILNLKSSSSYSFWVDMLSGFLSSEERYILNEKGEKILTNYSDIRNALKDKDKKIRDSAREALNDIIKKYENVAEAEINAVLENKRTSDKIRGYERPDKSSHLSDDVDSEVVDSLVKTVSKNFDLSKRFYKLKSKLLRIKKFKYEEREIDFGADIETQNFEKDVSLIKNVFLGIDKEFYDIVNRFFEEKRVDFFPKKGKRDGACCVHYGKLPVFVLLNHSGKLRDLQTIAHELGHGIHFELMKKDNNLLNVGAPRSTAEVASTFMEDFVIKELLENSDDEAKLKLILQKIQEDLATIMRQIACYKFEQELHEKFREKGYLSKKEIGNLFKKNMKDYLGDVFIDDEEMERGWIYWPHIREYFYVYSYASGLIISKTLQRKFKENPKYIGEIKKFFSAGTSKSPKEIFKDIGIDITKEEFWQEGINEISELLGEAEALAKKLGKI